MHHVDYEILQPRRAGEQSFMFVGLPIRRRCATSRSASLSTDVAAAPSSAPWRSPISTATSSRAPTTDHQEQPS